MKFLKSKIYTIKNFKNEDLKQLQISDEIKKENQILSTKQNKNNKNNKIYVTFGKQHLYKNVYNRAFIAKGFMFKTPFYKTTSTEEHFNRHLIFNPLLVGFSFFLNNTNINSKGCLWYYNNKKKTIYNFVNKENTEKYKFSNSLYYVAPGLIFYSEYEPYKAAYNLAFPLQSRYTQQKIKIKKTQNTHFLRFQKIDKNNLKNKNYSFLNKK